MAQFVLLINSINIYNINFIIKFTFIYNNKKKKKLIIKNYF